MRRCEDGDECRSPDGGELVQPRESFDLKLYYDEDRTYIVARRLVSARIRIRSRI